MMRRWTSLFLMVLAACSGGGGGGSSDSSVDGFGMGLGDVFPEDRDRFEHRFGAGAPSTYTWESQLPPIGDQGLQGSCVGWATAYYTKSTFEARAEGWNPDHGARQFSPSWVYNQINGGVDRGSQPREALELMVREGCATLASMPYDVGDYTTQPSSVARDEAAHFRNDGWKEFATYDVPGMVDYLSTVGPLILGIQVLDTFYQAGEDYLQASGTPQGLHAITCVGYDQSRNGGSFLLANSWGLGWGREGKTWIPFTTLGQILIGAWAMVDGPNTDAGNGGAPRGFRGVALAGFISLEWDPVSSATSYRLERALTTKGEWERLADLATDELFYQDLNVSAGSSYDYRVAALDDRGVPGEHAQITVVAVDGGDDRRPFDLTASHPNHGDAYPDLIVLEWEDPFSGSQDFYVFRGDPGSNFEDGGYDAIFSGSEVTGFEDSVVPGSAFSYVVIASDPQDRSVIGQSNKAIGATSGGGGGGIDLAILDGWGDVVVTRGAYAQASISVGNYSDQASVNQRVQTAVSWVSVDGSQGTLWHWDAPDGTSAIFDAQSQHEIPSWNGVTYSFSPIVPQFLNPDWNVVQHWWSFQVDPLDAGGQKMEDRDPSNNWFDYFYTLTIR